ncbi:MAG: glycosyltransferase family 39 protein [Bdellovibrionales bacterium]|nr:glycosyltransferase family 39 protein [Bdellovibrionales bacterium]
MSSSSLTERSRYSPLIIFGALVIGALLRLDFLFASHFIIDSDEAIVGLMAKHMSEGAPVPVFYYGQHYMGALEPLMLSFLFQWFGFVPELIKVVPLLFSLGFIVVCYFLGRELGGKTAAAYAALIAAVPPSVLVVWSTKARGGFIEIVFLVAVALLFSLYWYRDSKWSWARLGIVALIVGFGWWTNNQMVYVIPAVGMLVVWKSFQLGGTLFARLGRLFLASLFCILFSLVGGLPFWLYNLFHEFASFSQLLRDHQSDIMSHFEGFVSTAMPILTGGIRYWQKEQTFPYSVDVSYSILGLLTFLGLYGVVRRELSAVTWFTLMGTALVTAFVFIASPYGYLSEAPRYLLPIYVPLIPLFAGGLAVVEKRSCALALLLLGGLLSFHLVSAYLHKRAIPGEPFVANGERVSKDQREIIAALRERDITKVKTNYWIGYRLAYETAEEVTFVVFAEPDQVRIPQYEEGLSEGELQSLPYLLVPSQAKIVERGLEITGQKYSKLEASGYILLYDISQPVNDDLLYVLREGDTLTSTVENERLPLRNAFDGDVTTRWGSGQPQNPSMEIDLQFSEPITLTRIQYLLGEWKHDFPRKLEVVAVTIDGTEKAVLTTEDYAALVYIGRRGEPIAFLNPPLEVVRLKLLQKGAHPVLDWSIADVNLYVAR